MFSPTSTMSRLVRMQAALVHAADAEQTHQFRRMSEAFAASGGLCAADQAAYLLRGAYDQPVSKIARWIVDRQLMTCSWRGEILVPFFQFVGAPLRPMTVMTRLLAALDSTMSDWEIGVWLATGNVWLDGRAPVTALRQGQDADVLRAAQAEQFACLVSDDPLLPPTSAGNPAPDTTLRPRTSSRTQP